MNRLITLGLMFGNLIEVSSPAPDPPSPPHEGEGRRCGGWGGGMRRAFDASLPLVGRVGLGGFEHGV